MKFQGLYPVPVPIAARVEEPQEVLVAKFNTMPAVHLPEFLLLPSEKVERALTFSGTAGSQIGGTERNIFGQYNATNITALSNLSSAGTVNNTSAGVLYSTATSSIAFNSPFTLSGTLGALVGEVLVRPQEVAVPLRGSQAGCLSSADWTTFNGKQLDLVH